jgi:hypothetical protein
MTWWRQKQPTETIDVHTVEAAKAGNEDITEDMTSRRELELEVN